MIRKLLAVSFVLLTCSAWAFRILNFEGGTIYVSQEKGDDANDGLSWDKAKKTIQAGINAATNEWTVLVAPGDYGSTAADFTTYTYNEIYKIPTVAYVDKKIRLKASEGRDKTFITGAWSTASGNVNGVGDGAKRCVFISAVGAVVEGFTIRKGAVVRNSRENKGHGDNGGEADYVCGGAGVAASVGSQLIEGGASVGYAANPAYVVDCTIEDCRGFRGTAITRAVPINCLFRHNLANDSGHATYRVYCAYNCIYFENGPATGTSINNVNAPASSYCALNCTYINNNSDSFSGPSAAENARAYNCAFLGDAQESAGGVTTLFATNCVTTFTGGLRATGVDCKGGVAVCQTLSSFEQDFCPRPGSNLIGAGSRGLIEWARAWVPEEYLEADYYGNPRKLGLLDPDIDVGAVQSQGGGKKAECGGLVIGRQTKATVGGKTYEGTHAGNSWVVFEKHPLEQARITCTKAILQEVFGYKITALTTAGTTDFDVYRYPDRNGDNGLYLDVPLAKNNPQVRVEVNLTTNIVYVDSRFGDYSRADGSAQFPFETIQQGVNKASADSVVKVKPGTYDKGTTIAPIDEANDGQDTNSTPNRVYINKNLRLVSTDGAEKTIIKGAKDASATGAYGGCGPKAVRCILSKQDRNVAIQGFTITGGATDGDLTHRGRWDRPANPRWNSADIYTRGNYGGGGLRASNWSDNQENCVVTDSIFTDNTAYWGGAMYGGLAQRCLFYGNTAVDNDPGSSASPCGVFLMVTLNSCIVRDNTVKRQAVIMNSRPRYSTIYKQSKSGGSTYWSEISDVSNPTAEDALADPANGDFRVRSGSDAMSRPIGRDESSLVRYSTGDYYGRPRIYDVRDPLFAMAGAVQEVAFAIDVVPDHGSGASASTTMLKPGETVTVMATGGRPFLGFQVGDTFIEQTSRTYTFTAPEYDYLSYLTGPYSVKPVYQSDLYVDAVGGDDSNDGWTLATPKRTLANLMTYAGVMRGDTVHAAPGDYNEGSMKRPSPFFGSGAVQNGARVVIPEGVTLVGEEGSEKTFIHGYHQPGSPSNPSIADGGYGPLALRCVEMYPNARLKGFTLVDGATDWSTTQPTTWIDENYSGGGVLCKDVSALIENCTITNCNGRYAGGAVSGTLVGCRIVHCIGTTAYGGAMNGAYYGCYFDWCWDNVIGSPRAVENCLIGPNCWLYHTVGSKMNVLISGSSVPIDNSLILGQLSGKSTATYTSRNSVWLDQSGYKFSAASTNVTLVSAAEGLAQIDGDLRPIRQPNSLVLDRGDPKLVSAKNTHDLYGVQRVYNGKVDIGACEYDWLPVYEKALFSRKGATLSSASPGVISVEGNKVLVTDGKVAVKWPSGRTGVNNILDFTVTGGGTMKVYVNGELTEEYVAEESARRLKLELPLLADIEIEYVPSADDDDTVGALLAASSDHGGMAIILRPVPTAY